MEYCYTLTGTDYTVELAQFQIRTFAAGTSSAMLSLPPATVYEPRWSLNVFSGGNRGWDGMLAYNGRLSIGQSADWHDDVDTWFPDDSAPDHKGAGFEQLMEKLKKLGSLMRHAREDEVGGMTVG